MQEINVEEIMQEIREEIKEKGYTEDLLSFTPAFVEEKEEAGGAPCGGCATFDITEFHNLVIRANTLWNYPLASWTLPGGMGKVKKILFLMVRAVSRPFMRGPRTMDATVVQALNQLVGFMNAQNATIARLEQEIEALKEK